MAEVVLDSSAVLALLRDEPGADIVAESLDRAVMSSVNLQEVVKKLLEAGFDPAQARETIDTLGLQVVAHDAEDAHAAAALWSATRHAGRGLGDRSCMALAIRLDIPVVTADREWGKLDIPGLAVVLAR